jgi:flavin-dependent dehydrogenase
MNIAISGAGIAGGYLAKLLEKKGISPDVYDGMDHDNRCGCRSCGWGVPRSIGKYLADVGLDFNEYLIKPMTSMEFDGLVAKTPFCTINKPRLIKDLTYETGLKRQNLKIPDAENYDFIVDATGIARALLPPCRSDLTLPTLQHRVVVKSCGREHLEAGIYWSCISGHGHGYLWIFPIGNDQYHIGLWGIGLEDLNTVLDGFYRDLSGRFSFTKICSCDGMIRVASPHYSTPFYFMQPRKDRTSQVIVGIGESIGTVSPFTGEGIAYSLECARIFADSWPDLKRYSRSVLTRFAWMKKERETLDYLISERGRSGPRLQDRWRFLCNARRSGIGLPVPETVTRLKSFFQGAEGPQQGS